MVQEGGTLVSDFDGTMAQPDFHDLVVARLLPPGTPDPWHDERGAPRTHFEAMQACYAAIRATEQEVLQALDAMEIETELTRWVARLEAAGWRVVVASAGCTWYIERLLARAGVRLEVHANPGRFVEGQGLLMELPATSPYFSSSHGIDKAAVVRSAQNSSRHVAFAGDGISDVPAARLVAPELRFARAELAASLARQGLAFRPFQRWRDIAQMLLERTS